MASQQYIAIIGDIIRSRDIPDRRQAQENLALVLREINIKYAKALASAFLITLGDEFQGLISRGCMLPVIVSEIEMRLYPLRIRVGIGVGEIETAINPDISIGADGPAYHRARSCVQFLKDAEKRRKYPEYDIYLASENPLYDQMINAVFSLSAAIRKKWTPKQWETVRTAFETDDDREKMAQISGISVQMIQRHLASADYYTYYNALESLKSAFAQLAPGDGDGPENSDGEGRQAGV